MTGSGWWQWLGLAWLTTLGVVDTTGIEPASVRLIIRLFYQLELRAQNIAVLTNKTPPFNEWGVYLYQPNSKYRLSDLVLVSNCLSTDIFRSSCSQIGSERPTAS